MTTNSGKDLHKAEALRAMADGLHDEPAAVEPPHDPQSGPPAAEGAVGPVEHDIPVISLDPAARNARLANLEAGSRKARHLHMKQFMIPLLLTIGGLLLATATLMLMAGYGRVHAPVDPLDPDATTAVRHGTSWIKYVILASYPVGAFLVFGAWLFHRDIARSARR